METTTARPNGDLTTRVVQDEQGWETIRRDWDELHSTSATASAPLDFEWLRAWWRVYRPALGAAALRIVTIWRGPRLMAALPLYVQCGSTFGIRHLRFISTGEAESEETCAEYLDLLSVPGEEAACADCAWRAMRAMTWDHVELLNLPEGTSLLARDPSVRRFSLGACPVADLSGGFDAYLRRLSSNGRQQARRLLREGEDAAARFEILAMNQLDAGFRDLIRLHQDRWAREGRPGAFAAPRFVAFHRHLLTQWAPAGRAILARLSLGSEPVAMLYGFVARDRFEFYQSGVRVETSSPLRSPGNLCHLLLMKALADRGVTAYDFLRGSSSYKKRLATFENRLTAIETWRPTPRTAAFRSARFVGRAVRAGRRVLQRRAKPNDAVSSGAFISP